MFKKGQSGNPNGRPKGTTKKYLQERAMQLVDTLDSVGCDPFLILAQLALYAKESKVRCQAATELAQYLLPKQKAIELANKDDSGIKFYFNSPNPQEGNKDEKENVKA